MSNYGKILEYFNDVSFKIAKKLQKFVWNFEFFGFELRCSFHNFENSSFRFVRKIEVCISFASLIFSIIYSIFIFIPLFFLHKNSGDFFVVKLLDFVQKLGWTKRMNGSEFFRNSESGWMILGVTWRSFVAFSNRYNSPGVSSTVHFD